MTPNEAFRKANTAADVANITRTMAAAFSTDPSWGPFINAGQTDLTKDETYWGLFVNSAQRYSDTYQNEDGTVAAVWLPPNSTELSAEEEENLESFLLGLFGEETTKQLFETYEQFDKSTPDGEFYYLSLLAVAPTRRGEGLGMKLMRHNLKHYDKLGIPTYLESSNSINDVKYESLGYKKHGTFLTAKGSRVNTFWRDPVTF